MSKRRNTGKQAILLKKINRETEQVFVKILLIDDDEKQLWPLTQYLELNGFRVEGYACSDRALAALGSRSFDCVVTDYHLRERRGCEIVRAATNIGVPSVLITGSADRTEIARSVNLGARFVLVKPYEPQELAERIREAVRENGLAGRIDGIIRKIGGND
jgi:two-component system C4-dicarboxylate transport response regulator DctD